MKIAVIGFNDMISMPYMRFYKRTLESFGVKADYYCWNRKGNGEIKKEENVTIINIKCPENRFGKIFAMLKWRRTILKELRNIKYEKIILLTSLPAVLLGRYLLKHYRNNYILDIRDFTYENLDIYKKVMKRIVEHSFTTFISSPGFRRILLTQKNVMQIHNIDVNFAAYGAPDLNKNILTLGYIGLIAYDKSCIMVIEKLSGTKYKLLFRGIYKNSILQDFCKVNGINGVSFEGKFSSEEKNKIYENIDIVNCVYGVKGEPYKQYALPNRLYDALYCCRPIFALKGTALAEYIDKYAIGLTVDEDDDFKNKLDDYISDFNPEKFENNINKCRSVIEEEQQKAISTIRDFVNNEENCNIK